jgi:hypothetical protein
LMCTATPSKHWKCCAAPRRRWQAR